LSDKLSNSKTLYFDDYELIDCPDDICEWVDKRADYNEWDLTPIIKDVEFLLNNHNQSLNYILVDYPFAYLHSGMDVIIDGSLTTTLIVDQIVDEIRNRGL
jgi:uridine kinase